MFRRNAMPTICGALLLGSAGLSMRASAQGAPFTIRMPPTGATVRETVAIKIPAASISPGGSVAFFIDGKFVEALAPKFSSSDPYFVYFWNTKAGVKDGTHTIKAELFEPSANGGGNKDSMDLAGTSQITVNVANIIHDGPSILKLRYHYPEGQTLFYNANVHTSLVGSQSDTGVSSNVPISSASANLLLDIEDGSQALVRNKLTKLTLLNNGQQITIPKDMLSASVYQVIDPLGNVHYQYTSVSPSQSRVDQESSVGSAVPLPTLPDTSVEVGQTWSSPDQRIHINGIPDRDTSHITLRSKLVDLEWQNGYPTAHIHQTFESGTGGMHLPPYVYVGGIAIQHPHITFSRDIYIAYTAGRLIKVSQTISVKGDTNENLQAAQGGRPGMGGYGTPGQMGGGKFGGMMGPGGMPGAPGGYGGMMGPGGMPGAPGGMMGPGGYGRPGGMPGAPGGYGGPGGMMGGPGGYPGPGGMPGAPGGYGGPGGMMGPGGYGRPGGMMGRPGGFAGRRGGFQGMPGAPMGGFASGGGMGYPGGMGGGGMNAQQLTHPVTVQLTTAVDLASIK